MKLFHKGVYTIETIPENFNPTYVRNITGSEFQQYHYTYPMDLIFETVHPDNPDDNFIVSYFCPDFSSNISLSYEEAQSIVYCRTHHQHDFFELLYVIKGEMFQTIENKRHLYPEGSLCLLNRNIYHTEEFSTDFRTVFLSISPELIEGILRDTESFFFSNERNQKKTLPDQFFSSNLNVKTMFAREYIDFIPCGNQHETNQHMYSLFEQIVSVFVSKPIGSTYLIKSLLVTIFDSLTKEENYQTIPINIGTDFEAQLFDKTTKLMRDSHGRISRSALEKELNYNGAYINKIIQKYTGLSIFHYGMTFCMKEAKNLLQTTELSISGIAEILNFSNRTHFYKLFKDYTGVTPSEYRERVK